MYLVDYHTHPYSHGEVENYSRELYIDFIKKAEEMNIKELGFSDHDEFDKNINLKIIDKVQPETTIKILKGLEFDYIPGREKEIADKIQKYSLDYAIGSVHFLGEWGFDHPDYIKEYNNRDINQCYRDYFKLLIKAVESDLFNIVGHMDLIKVFGYRPDFPVLEVVEPVLEVIKNRDVAVEINTNGLNKPVREIYPSVEILKRVYRHGIPITFGSDAHSAGRIGEKIKKYYKIAREIGFTEIAVFKNGIMSAKEMRI